MKKAIAAIILLIFSISEANGEIILSEILANEPDSRILLEWLEVYNNGGDQIDLQGYSLTVGADTIYFAAGTVVMPYDYAVLCRRLEPSNGSDCFEYYWGDSSGVWGDNVAEDYLVYEIGITLTNGAGEVSLLDAYGDIVDRYTWNRSSDDGRSEERDDVTNLLSGWHYCYDPAGSTPGKVNSSRPANNETLSFRIEPQLISRSEIERTVTMSYAAPSGAKISLLVYDGSARKIITLLERSGDTYGVKSWDLTDDGGKLLPPGLYIISLTADGEVADQSIIPVVIAP